MRGVSERVGGPGGVGCGEQPRGTAVPRTPWHRARPQVPRRGEAAAGAGRPPSPTAGRGPGGCGRRGEGASRGAYRRPGQAPRPPSRVRAAGGGRGRAGPQGGRPAALEEPREQKETATGSSVVKTTCAGCGPRPGRGLGARRLNPFAAASRFLRLAGGPKRRPSRDRPDAGCGRRRDGTRARHGAPATLAAARTSRLPGPAPFPPGFRVDLPTHCYVRPGGVAAPIRPNRSRRRSRAPPRCQLAFGRRRAPSAPCMRGREGCSSCGARAQVWRASGALRPDGWISEEPPVLLAPQAPEAYPPACLSLSGTPPRPGHKLLLGHTGVPGMP